MRANKNDKSSFTLAIICVVFILWVLYSVELNTQDRKLNKFETICLVYGFKKSRSSKIVEVMYYFEGKKLISTEYVEDEPEQYVNRYFKVEISKLNPKNSKVFLNKEILDSTQIVNSGFSYK